MSSIIKETTKIHGYYTSAIQDEFEDLLVSYIMDNLRVLSDVGFICTGNTLAKLVYEGGCPDLQMQKLKNIIYMREPKAPEFVSEIGFVNIVFSTSVEQSFMQMVPRCDDDAHQVILYNVEVTKEYFEKHFVGVDSSTLKFKAVVPELLSQLIE